MGLKFHLYTRRFSPPQQTTVLIYTRSDSVERSPGYWDSNAFALILPAKSLDLEIKSLYELQFL
ncbi:MAG: hypothetical protein SRB2_01436 [Desulfobacteraceae bacterium Eth-SRB2]|nr:MAG: hypothetical protein SRB2_01436 [Desulfobacteraceae bacterium Eth-SRB2]